MASRIRSDKELLGGDHEVVVITDFTHHYHHFICRVPRIVYNWEIEGEVQLIKYVRKYGVKTIRKYKLQPSIDRWNRNLTKESNS
jgi:hypothetical protein